MPSYSKTSLNRLNTAAEDLKILFMEVVKTYDNMIVCGHRGKAEQDEAVAKGLSKTPYPTSKHNSTPSEAVDAVPFVNGKISWDTKECEKFGRYVLRVAKKLKIKIRWGGNWSSDPEAPLSNKFVDMPHFEIVR